jgi:hypothetical protein
MVKNVHSILFTAKFVLCTFLPLLVGQYVDTKRKVYNYIGKYITTISELFYNKTSLAGGRWPHLL